jgi:hypothetical protein
MIWTCDLCNGAMIDLSSDGWDEAVVNHVRLLHPGELADPERWPDGRLVVEDHTLTPDDFTGPETT